MNFQAQLTIFTLCRYLVTIFVTLVLSCSFATAKKTECSNVFTINQKLKLSYDVFSDLETLEVSLQGLNNLVNSSFGHDGDINKALKQVILNLGDEMLLLQDMQERAIEDQLVEPSELSDLIDRLENFEREIYDIREGILIKDQVSSNLYKDVVLDPSKVISEHVYVVETSQGNSIKVLFSEDIVNNLFLSKNTNSYRAIKKSLVNIGKGLFAPGYSGEGITWLIDDSTIVKVRTNKSNAIGRFRLYGYKSDGVFHFVFSTDNSNHSGDAVRKNTTKVNNIKKKRGH